MSKYKVQCGSCWKVYNLDYKPRDKPICTDCQRRGLWASRDGNILHVSKMTDSHLRNLKNFLIQKAQDKYSEYKSSAYATATFVQGEMAHKAIWDEIDYMESEGHWSDIYYNYAIVESLENEIDKRGVKDAI